MPWKVRKRDCRQKSTERGGSYAVVKIKRDGGEEQESCHTSKPKAQGAHTVMQARLITTLTVEK